MVSEEELRTAVARAHGILAQQLIGVSASDEDLRRWFAAETAYPDLSLEEVLAKPLLVVHELVEISETRRMGIAPPPPPPMSLGPMELRSMPPTLVPPKWN